MTGKNSDSEKKDLCIVDFVLRLSLKYISEGHCIFSFYVCIPSLELMTDLVLQYCHFPLYALSFPGLMEVPTVVVVVLKLYRNYFLQLFRHEHLYAP